jgi:hypothetical protein
MYIPYNFINSTMLNRKEGKCKLWSNNELYNYSLIDSFSVHLVTGIVIHILLGVKSEQTVTKTAKDKFIQT